LSRFSLLDSSSSSSVDARSFGRIVTLFLYLKPNFVISSLIVDTFKSACMTLLDIYHGILLLLGGIYFDISVIFQCLNY